MHGFGLASPLANQTVTTTYPETSVEGVISDIIEHGRENITFRYAHGHCEGLTVGTLDGGDEVEDDISCSVLDCEEPEIDILVNIGEQSSPFHLCANHLWYWLENEVEVTCQECAAWFEDTEVAE